MTSRGFQNVDLQVVIYQQLENYQTLKTKMSTPEQRQIHKESQAKNKAKFLTQSMEKNPCYMESKMALDCANDKSKKCAREYDNYNVCRQFWSDIQADRKRKGIKPPLPPLEERSAVMEEYRYLLPKYYGGKTLNV